jgi:hypothetical protein
MRTIKLQYKIILANFGFTLHSQLIVIKSQCENNSHFFY